MNNKMIARELLKIAKILTSSMSKNQLEAEFEEMLKKSGAISTLYTRGSGGTSWGVSETTDSFRLWVMNKGRFENDLKKMMKQKYPDCIVDSDSFSASFIIKK